MDSNKNDFQLFVNNLQQEVKQHSVKSIQLSNWNKQKQNYINEQISKKKMFFVEIKTLKNMDVS